MSVRREVYHQDFFGNILKLVFVCDTIEMQHVDGFTQKIRVRTGDPGQHCIVHALLRLIPRFVLIMLHNATAAASVVFALALSPRVIPTFFNCWLIFGKL